MYKLSKSSWYLERVIFLIAGIFVFGSIFLSLTISGVFMFFTGIVGFLLIIFALTGYCPMAITLNKFGVKGKLAEEDERDKNSGEL